MMIVKPPYLASQFREIQITFVMWLDELGENYEILYYGVHVGMILQISQEHYGIAVLETSKPFAKGFKNPNEAMEHITSNVEDFINFARITH